jgi:hypothetical protein
MFSSYSVVPMLAEGDIYALCDPEGNRVVMGTGDVCRTLLYLLTNSPLMEKPPRYYERTAPRQRVKSEDVQEDASPLPSPASHAHISEGSARPSGAAGDAGADRVTAEPRSVTAHPALRPRKSGVGPGAVSYGLLGGNYLGSQPASSYWYVGLYVVLVIGSALLTCALFLRL